MYKKNSNNNFLNQTKVYCSERKKKEKKKRTRKFDLFYNMIHVKKKFQQKIKFIKFHFATDSGQSS